MAVWGERFSPLAIDVDPMRGSDALPSLSQLPHAQHCGVRLHSAFQPIISVAHSKIVGHEALVRGRTQSDEALQPADLFPRLQAEYSAVQILEICALLHLRTFTQLGHEGWLFLNVNPNAALDR